MLSLNVSLGNVVTLTAWRTKSVSSAGVNGPDPLARLSCVVHQMGLQHQMLWLDKLQEIQHGTAMMMTKRQAHAYKGTIWLT